MGKSLPLKVNPKRLDKTKQGECMEELQGFFTCMTASWPAHFCRVGVVQFPLEWRGELSL